MSDSFSLAARARSFLYAARGVRVVVQSQHNAWIHLVATLGVLGLGLFLGVGAIEWCLLVLAFVAVWSCEVMNTALEFLADAASPDYHPLVEKAKDAAAGAVLIAAVGSVVIGLIVLGPPLWGVLAGSG